MEQSQIERLLREKARRRVPTLQKALANTIARLAKKDEFVAKATARAEAKVARWEKLRAMYLEDLETIAAGSYRGYNGKPFGAAPTMSEGLL